MMRLSAALFEPLNRRPHPPGTQTPNEIITHTQPIVERNSRNDIRSAGAHGRNINHPNNKPRCCGWHVEHSTASRCIVSSYRG